MQSSDARPGSLIGSTLGGYRLTALLGAGGMAEVYRGLDPQLDRPVAVKVLPAHLAQDPGYVARFRVEAQRVAALTHPNIVPVYRFGEDRGLLYLVMPVLEESLRERMDRGDYLPPSDAARLAVQIAAALDAAHAQGVVHRDVKPENILLTAEGRGLLTDFGISRELDVLRAASSARTLAATGLPVGTPEYMAPEQLRGGSADQRVDVYALGAVLYEMLTGHVPHDAETPYEVAAKVLTERALPPSEYNPAIWPELEDVVLGALAIDPDDRYPDMRSFAGALRRAVLQRESRTALVAAGSVGLAPTPLARTLATRRLGQGEAIVTSAPIYTPRGLGSARPGKVGLRKPKPLVALAIVLAVAVALGGATLVMGAFGPLLFPPGSPTGGTGLTGPGTTPVVTVDITATVGVGGTLTPGATVVLTPTIPLVPTATSRPTPSATPHPTLTVSPSSVVMQPQLSHYCANTGANIVTMTTDSTTPILWRWTTALPGTWYYSVNSSSYSSTLPSGTISSSKSVTISIREHVSDNSSCGTGTPTTVIITYGSGWTTSFTLTP